MADPQSPQGPQTLEERLARLETVVEDLQDALHRQAIRQDREIHELHRRTEPAQIARDLSQDARTRGL